MTTEASALWEMAGEGPVLYLAPHSDDAAFASAGLLHACTRRGVTVHLVTCFSVSGHSRNGLGHDPAVVTPARKEEDRRFVATLPGPVELAWLDLPDAPLRPDRLGQHPCRVPETAGDRRLVAVLEERVVDAVDGASLVLAPLGLGGHVDHEIVRDAAAVMARDGRARVAFWEDLPYAGRLGRAELEREIDACIAATGLALEPIELLDSRLVEHKRQALACYPSQVVSVHRRGVLDHVRRLSRHDVARERLWLHAGSARR